MDLIGLLATVLVSLKIRKIWKPHAGRAVVPPTAPTFKCGCIVNIGNEHINE